MNDFFKFIKSVSESTGISTGNVLFDIIGGLIGGAIITSILLMKDFTRAKVNSLNSSNLK